MYRTVNCPLILEWTCNAYTCPFRNITKLKLPPFLDMVNLYLCQAGQKMFFNNPKKLSAPLFKSMTYSHNLVTVTSKFHHSIIKSLWYRWQQYSRAQVTDLKLLNKIAFIGKFFWTQNYVAVDQWSRKNDIIANWQEEIRKRELRKVVERWLEDEKPDYWKMAMQLRKARTGRTQLMLNSHLATQKKLYCWL